MKTALHSHGRSIGLGQCLWARNAAVHRAVRREGTCRACLALTIWAAGSTFQPYGLTSYRHDSRSAMREVHLIRYNAGLHPSPQEDRCDCSNIEVDPDPNIRDNKVISEGFESVVENCDTHHRFDHSTNRAGIDPGTVPPLFIPVKLGLLNSGTFVRDPRQRLHVNRRLATAKNENARWNSFRNEPVA